MIYYENLTAVLVEAVKEQQEQINSLKQTVQELSTKLADCCP
jgi:phage shock protein A